MSVELQREDGQRLQRCLESGGVAVFPSDTVYGVCCDAEDEAAARRMYALKGRSRTRSSAVMFFTLERALAGLSDLEDAERRALEALLPGPATLLLANRGGGFAPACREDLATLGLRVPRLPENLAALAEVQRPLMQTSANLSGEPDARSLTEVPRSLLDGVDEVLDGGDLPGVASTVIDLREFGSDRSWYLLREGALPRTAVEKALAALG
jgi:L-threonylcarbamoyladenylate synthase